MPRVSAWLRQDDRTFASFCFYSELRRLRSVKGAIGLDPSNHFKTLVYDGTTGLDRTRQDSNSPDVAAHTKGLRVVTTARQDYLHFFNS